MKLVIRYYKSFSPKEKAFRIEAEVNELITHGEAFVVLDKKEYLIEVRHDR